MTEPLALLRLHVEALFPCDPAGRLLRVNDPGARTAPRFLIGRTASGNAWWFRNDLDERMEDELAALARACTTSADLGPHDGFIDPFTACLARDAPASSIWSGPAFHFPAAIGGEELLVSAENVAVLSPYLEDWIADVAPGVPMTAVLDEDGRAASVCCSVRVTPRAHEAGVETHPHFRGRGYGVRVVAAWATAVRAMRRLPLYSTSWQNHASIALARRLGLVQYGATAHIT